MIMTFLCGLVVYVMPLQSGKGFFHEGCQAPPGGSCDSAQLPWLLVGQLGSTRPAAVAMRRRRRASQTTRSPEAEQRLPRTSPFMLHGAACHTLPSRQAKVAASTASLGKAQGWEDSSGAMTRRVCKNNQQALNDSTSNLLDSALQ